MWICCQLGAREHYSIPHALNTVDELALLVTDAWADSWLPWNLRSNSRGSDRYHPAIPSSKVASFDWSYLFFETAARVRLSGWELTMARNEWFQDRALGVLRKLKKRNPGSAFTLFSYSYTARRLFEFARKAGWSTVLGQIDPGPYEEEIVMNLNRASGSPAPERAAPKEYWDHWRDECRLADRIIVNSEWSRHGLSVESTPSQKLRVVPLLYDAPPEVLQFVRKYPPSFDVDRPLRILFLGLVNLRKGAAELFAAADALVGLPVEFHIVGPLHLTLDARYRDHPLLKWVGPVPRSMVSQYYREADIFLFPTFSDGFGLTQLEAQAWSLPIIASKNCGDVVRHLDNGYLLQDVTSSTIVEAVNRILAEPEILSRMAGNARSKEFASSLLAGKLAAVMEER